MRLLNPTVRRSDLNIAVSDIQVGILSRVTCLFEAPYAHLKYKLADH